jgi:hypothetical protein
MEKLCKRTGREKSLGGILAHALVQLFLERVDITMD